MKQLIYADNAATTKMDIEAYEVMKKYFIEEYANASQPYSFSREPRKVLEEARETIAVCINAEPSEIFFTSCGTESDNWALKGTLLDAPNKGNIVTSEFEHHAVLNCCIMLEKIGFPVRYVRPTADGVILPAELGKIVDENTKIVSIMLANNEIGTIQPIKELAEIAHKSGAVFHTDAVQCVGHIPVDVKELGIDMLSASAHKFNGPKGVGFLYVKKGTAITPLLHGGSQEKGYRAGTENIPAIVGMSIALKNNCDRIETNMERIKNLEEEFVKFLEIKQIPFIRNGNSNSLPGIINLSFAGYDGEAILHRLDLMGIQVSTGSACDSVNTQISHVLRAIELDEKKAKGTIRISLGKDNTYEEIEKIALALDRIINRTL